jgi:hypothetical protein
VQGGGKRKGSRKAPKTQVQLDPSMLLHAAGVTFCVIAWGYLVSAAIDFGSSARSGRSEAWLFLAVACIGAACCLFAGLMLGTRLLRALGLAAGPAHEQSDTAELPVAGSTYTSHSAHPAHGSHSSHGSHGAHSVNGAPGHTTVPTPRHPGGGHRAHR